MNQQFPCLGVKSPSAKLSGDIHRTGNIPAILFQSDPEYVTQDSSLS